MAPIILISLTIPMALILLNSSLHSKKKFSREKSSPFECGFDPKIIPRSSFSIKFYLIAIIFLIFDIEIALIFPAPLILKITNNLTTTTLISLFFMVLMLGLVYEWKEGALNWLK